MIKALLHSALSVSDMDRSLEFYSGLLGMKIIMDIDAADERIGRVIGVPGAKCRIVHLELGCGMLELFEYSEPQGENRAQATEQFDHGLTHIGFEVDHIHDHIRELEENQVEFLGEPVEFRPGVWVVYFRGPDGEVCEFRQRESE